MRGARQEAIRARVLEVVERLMQSLTDDDDESYRDGYEDALEDMRDALLTSEELTTEEA